VMPPRIRSARTPDLGVRRLQARVHGPQTVGSETQISLSQLPSRALFGGIATWGIADGALVQSRQCLVAQRCHATQKRTGSGRAALLPSGESSSPPCRRRK
jgi:hypothetical protein